MKYLILILFLFLCCCCKEEIKSPLKCYDTFFLASGNMSSDTPLGAHTYEEARKLAPSGNIFKSTYCNHDDKFWNFKDDLIYEESLKK